jgi:hypothetical protein
MLTPAPHIHYNLGLTFRLHSYRDIASLEVQSC